MATQVLTPLGAEQPQLPFHAPPARRWSVRSVAILVLAWAVLQLGGLFTPGLLDDVDSVYVEVAREMLQRHDFVTPYADGIRFFDKPPLMYWLAAGAMKLFGPYDWAARLPLALLVLGLLLAVYALGIRLFAHLTPYRPDRAGFYSALAIATSIGPYLFTRFFIPDIALALWMTLAVHLFLRILDEASATEKASRAACWMFAVVVALNVLTKGLIGLVFPIAVVLIYLALSGQLRLLRRMRPLSSALAFLAVAGPWHILAALRNPPDGAARGWLWFYFVNEHFMRFLGRRIPHDYGQVPLLLFWVLLVVWLAPWAAFLPRSLREAVIVLRGKAGFRHGPVLRGERRTVALLAVWTLVVLCFFSLSSRQEYYSLPALPALALLIGRLLAREDSGPDVMPITASNSSLDDLEATSRARARRSALLAHRWIILPLAVLISGVCAWFGSSSTTPAPGADISSLLRQNPDNYTLSLGHLFDLTPAAMGLFKLPLLGVAAAMLLGSFASYVLRHRGRYFAANLTLAAAACGVLLCAHSGLAIFYPTLGSKPLALAINRELQPGDLILLDGEYTSGSSINFYTRHQVGLVNGRVNGVWYGSFWPDAPAIFEDDASLQHLWGGPRRVFLVTQDPARSASLAHFGPVIAFASSGGKTVLTNR